MFLLTVSLRALAKQNCTDVQQKSGGAAYQRCLSDNQEELIRNQVTTYRTTIDRYKETVKAGYDRRINEENYAWKDADLGMQLEEAEHKYRVDQLGSSKENAEQLEIEKNGLKRIQKIRSLTSTVHNNKLRRLQQLRDTELLDSDNAVSAYELQLWQQNTPAQ